MEVLSLVVASGSGGSGDGTLLVGVHAGVHPVGVVRVVVAVVDGELEGLITELLELVDLVGVLVGVDHAQSLSGQLVAVDAVDTNHVVRGGGGALLLVAVDVEVVVVRTVVDQATHVVSVGVVREQHRLVGGEDVGELLVGQSLVVLLGGLQGEQVGNVHNLELDAQFLQLVGSSHDLLSRDIAGGGKHDLGLIVVLGGGSPIPSGGTLLELGTSLVQGQPGGSRLLTSDDGVDLVGGLVALLGDGQQHVRIGGEVDADDVVVVEALVQQDGASLT